MALYQKQDFIPPVLSRRWIAMQFRPNMLLYCQDHVVAILESGLLFREDSVEIDQEAMYWMDEGGGWLTTGEKLMSVVAVSALFAAFPIRRVDRGAAVRLASYAGAPLAVRAAHRHRCGGSVRALLTAMCDYLAVARRAAACCREYAALHANIASVATAAASLQTLLVQQQSALVTQLSRASSAVLGNAPWLRGDVAWEATCRPGDSLMKIHHTFLVVQSLLLKHVAMAHYMAPNISKVYKNHNERIYWLHNVVLKYLIAEYKENYEALERMYRLLKNCGTIDQNEARKPGAAINNSWLYSEVHTDIARSCLELKIAHTKCTGIDIFLDSCGCNKTEVDLDILNKDIDDLIDNITKCLSTAQGSQIRLKKLQGRIKPREQSTTEDENCIPEEDNIVTIEDKVPEAKDEVFYFVKTEDDEVAPQAADVTTGPGQKEKENSKVVMNELKRKLGKREDVMRERERQALKKTMPEYKDNVPEFPRQIEVENFMDRKGYIKKIMVQPKKRLFKRYKIGRTIVREIFKKGDKYILLSALSYERPIDIRDELYEANAGLHAKSEILTILRDRKTIIVTKYRFMEGGYSSGLSDVDEESFVLEDHLIPNGNGSDNYKFSRKDLELSPSSSEEDLRGRLASLLNAGRHGEDGNDYGGEAGDYDQHPEEYNGNSSQDIRGRLAMIVNARRQREVGKYNREAEDESLRPIEYRFGTGMAMASVLQGNSSVKIPTMAHEEVFIGDGEVSDDSGNSGED